MVKKKYLYFCLLISVSFFFMVWWILGVIFLGKCIFILVFICFCKYEVGVYFLGISFVG